MTCGALQTAARLWRTAARYERDGYPPSSNHDHMAGRVLGAIEVVAAERSISISAARRMVRLVARGGAVRGSVAS